jgi:hypothetical protein
VHAAAGINARLGGRAVKAHHSRGCAASPTGIDSRLKLIMQTKQG